MPPSPSTWTILNFESRIVPIGRAIFLLSPIPLERSYERTPSMRWTRSIGSGHRLDQPDESLQRAHMHHYSGNIIFAATIIGLRDQLLTDLLWAGCLAERFS